jgi:hypothetical protein
MQMLHMTGVLKKECYFILSEMNVYVNVTDDYCSQRKYENLEGGNYVYVNVTYMTVVLKKI